MSDATLAELLHRVRNRFYGKYRGAVVEVEEGGRGRIKAKVPAVFGELTTGWCDPCVPYAGNGVGVVFLPEPGTGVWIEFEGGDLSYPIWSGCYWREGEFPSEAAPGKKAIVTKSKHALVFDDDGETITLTDANGAKITFDSGGVHIAKGSFKIDVTDSKVTINDTALEVV